MDQARTAGLDFVPAVWPSRHRESCLEHQGRVWELTDWMPGTADFRERPTDARLISAVTALARLHLVWGEKASKAGTCPAVQRRLDRAAEWSRLLAAGWRPSFTSPAGLPWHHWAERAWHILGGRMPEVSERLTPWTDISLPLQPCLCDVWHDHVLFTGDVVTGLIDYAGIKTDHVAVDLARLLGSLVGDNASRRRLALDSYSRLRPLSGPERGLIDVLDETGTVLAAANWVRWLYHDGRRFEDGQAVAGRLAALVERLEQ
jgi:Ser/Thr protein kinase RdoA (MazF antagonist)